MISDIENATVRSPYPFLLGHILSFHQGKKITHHRAHISLLRRARECVAGRRRRVWRGLRRRTSRRRRGRAAPGGLGGGAPGSSHGEHPRPPPRLPVLVSGEPLYLPKELDQEIVDCRGGAKAVGREAPGGHI